MSGGITVPPSAIAAAIPPSDLRWLSTQRHIGARCVIQHSIASPARHPIVFGRNCCPIESYEPVHPVGPPAAWVLLRTRQKCLERSEEHTSELQSREISYAV